MSKPKLSLYLDSGAFSAFTQNKSINLDEYCDFILANQQHIEQSIALDVIGPNDPEVAAAAGRENYLKMRDKGVSSVPVLHARERTKWLDLMLGDADLIGLSGTSLVSPREDRDWHNLIWSYCTDSKGFPIAKFHSFGNTSTRVLLTYPFYSADSSTYMISAGRAARIKIQGKTFQIRSQKIKDSNYILATDTGPKKQSSDEAIRTLGMNPDRLLSVQATPSQLAMLRSYLVAADLLQLQAQSISCTKFKTPSSLLSIKKQLTGGTERKEPVRCYFVLSPSAFYMNFPVVLQLGITRVLLSYYYVATAPQGWWQNVFLPFMYDPEDYCQTDPKLKENLDLLRSCLAAQPGLAAQPVGDSHAMAVV